MVINQRLSRVSGRKAVVLFTDGVDTTSRHGTYDSNIRDAEELDALVYPAAIRHLHGRRRRWRRWKLARLGGRPTHRSTYLGQILGGNSAEVAVVGRRSRLRRRWGGTGTSRQDYEIANDTCGNSPSGPAHEAIRPTQFKILVLLSLK